MLWTLVSFNKHLNSYIGTDMAETICDLNLFKSMDMKTHDGILPLMFAFKAEGFEDEFSNSILMRKLNQAADMLGVGVSHTIRTFCCYVAIAGVATKVLRIELRNKNNQMSGTNIVVREGEDGCLEVVG